MKLIIKLLFLTDVVYLIVIPSCAHIRLQSINEQLQLNGEADKIGSIHSLDSFESACFSINFWYKTDEISQYQDSTNYEITDTGTFKILVKKNSGNLKISIVDTGSNNEISNFAIEPEEWSFISLTSDSSIPKINSVNWELKTLNSQVQVISANLDLDPSKSLIIGKSNPRNFKGKISGFYLSQTCDMDNPDKYISASQKPYFKMSYLLGYTPFDYLNNIARQDGKPRMMIGDDYSDNLRPEIMPLDSGNSMNPQLFFRMKSNSFLNIELQKFKDFREDNGVVYWVNFYFFYKWKSFPTVGNAFVFLNIEDKNKLKFGINNSGKILLYKGNNEEVTGTVLHAPTLNERSGMKGLIGFGPNTIYLKIGNIIERIESN